MALDNAEFISELSIIDPPGTDPLNQGDDHIRTTKKAVQQSFPNVDAAVPQSAAQMAQMAIKNEANTFTLVNTFLASLRAANNTAVTPSYGFTSATGNGMWNPSATALAFSTAGVERLRVSDTQIRSRSPNRGVEGSISGPTYSFESATTTGMFRNASGQLAFAHNGVQVATMASTNFDTTLKVRVQGGTAALPAFTFTGDPAKGLYSIDSNRLGIATGGALRFEVNNQQMRANVPQLAATPAYSFSADLTSGMYLEGAGSLRFATSGAFRFLLESSRTESAAPFRGPDGTEALPAYSFSADPDTGFYRTVGNINAVADGTTVWAMSSNGMFAGVGFVIHADGNLTAATKPGFSFANDADSGFYRASANSVSVAVGGSTALNFDFSTLAMWAGAGYAIRGDPARVAAQPAYAYTNDTDTGMFRRATNAIGFAAGGVEICNVGTGGFGIVSGKLAFLNLPTSPSTGGSLWNDAGTVKVA